MQAGGALLLAALLERALVAWARSKAQDLTRLSDDTDLSSTDAIIS